MWLAKNAPGRGNRCKGTGAAASSWRVLRTNQCSPQVESQGEEGALGSGRDGWGLEI